MGRSIPFFGAASRADGDTRLGVSLRCIQDQERRCLVLAGQDIVLHLSSLFDCPHTAASLVLDDWTMSIAICLQPWPQLRTISGPVPKQSRYLSIFLSFANGRAWKTRNVPWEIPALYRISRASRLAEVHSLDRMRIIRNNAPRTQFSLETIPRC